MLKNRPILKFAASFVLFYSGFLILNEVPEIRKAHNELFASMGEWVYNSWHPNLKADISTDVEAIGADVSNDFVLTAYDKKAYKSVRTHNARNPSGKKQFKPVAYMAFKARMSHSVAAFFLLSLILASPNSWKRKLIGCIIGLYLLYILVAMKLTFLLEMADESRTVDDGLWYILSNTIGNNEAYQELYYILILTIWMIVALSKESISTLTSTLKPQ